VLFGQVAFTKEKSPTVEQEVRESEQIRRLIKIDYQRISNGEKLLLAVETDM
jgi:hypothetical protein